MRSTTLLPPPPPISSRPPRPSSDAETSPPASGKHPIPSAPPPHEDLTGGKGSAVRFRPARLNAGELPNDLRCRFRCEGTDVGPLAVLDMSVAGLAAESSVHQTLPPGTVLESFELLMGDQLIWSGEAVVVHGSEGRIGARFTSGVLDLTPLRLGATVSGRLATRTEQRSRLPLEWRAAVADLRLLLEDIRLELDQLEREETGDPMRREEEEQHIFERMLETWGQAFYGAVSELHDMSAGFDRRTEAHGRGYASSMLMPILAACPLHRRAYEKPLGYAGDYRMMELCFVRQLGGDGLFGRFLHFVGQNYTLVRAVVAREQVTRQAIRAAAESEGEGPVRVLALAAGAAIELRRFLDETRTLRRPVELILLDQDREAHETSHKHLTRALLERHRGSLPVTVECLHFSVRQLLRPQTAPDESAVRETLANLDLVYSSGLYDYLPERVATSLTELLYSKLRVGGRLLLGNLMETADSTWMMDYVLAWSLIYRTEEDMLALGRGLRAAASRIGITRDATGRCLFLDVIKRTSAPGRRSP